MAPLASRQSLGEHRGHVVTLVVGSRKYTKKTIVLYKKEAWQEIGVFVQRATRTGTKRPVKQEYMPWYTRIVSTKMNAGGPQTELLRNRRSSTKIQAPSAKRYFRPPDEQALSRSLFKTAAPLLFTNKSTVKHFTWSNN